MKEKIMLTGLCGRSGAGKGYVSSIFSEYGIPSIDTDDVYRKMTSPSNVLSPCMKELKENFGDAVVSDDNSLNRKEMRKLVFGENNKNLNKLNEITHKYILSDTMKKVKELYTIGYNIILIDAPVLFESGFDKMCEKIVCVTSSDDILLSRIMKRDLLSEEDARARLAAQKSFSELEALSDFVIYNDCEKDELKLRVKECVMFLRSVYDEKFGHSH